MTINGIARLTGMLLHIGPLIAVSGLLGVAQLLSPWPRSSPYHARGWVIRQILLGVVWYDPSVRERASRLLERMDEVDRSSPARGKRSGKPTPPRADPAVNEKERRA